MPDVIARIVCAIPEQPPHLRTGRFHGAAAQRENVRYRQIQFQWMRIMARNLIEESGLICGQWQSHELNYEYRKYAHRSMNIEEYKRMFGEEYDPLWDLEKKPSKLEDFPYEWPYVTSEELPGKKEDRPYMTANSSSALDLDFIVNAEEDVVALMLHEQQRQPAAEDDNITFDDVEDRLPKTRSVPLSSSQLSLFQDDEPTQELQQRDSEILVKDGEEVQSIDDLDDATDDVADKTTSMMEETLARMTPETATSELLEFQSSKDIGIRSRSKIVIGESSDQLLGENETLPDDAEGKFIGKMEEESIGTSSEQLHFPDPSSRGLPMDSDALIIGGKGSLGGDPSYPEIWRDFSEDECVSEGESIPSPRSSPSNVTDFSEITEVELYVPSDAEDEPYVEYYDESAPAPTGPTSAKRPSQTGPEEPTEEYMGDSDDDEIDPRGVPGDDSATDTGVKRARRKSALRGRPVATPPSESSDDEA
ncbi:unnamed protein product [Nesidiocoris tenuis]|uniref:Uncharacterized protein n=1 Tax=Nesidiocoris tenuis TaxID=355587 RepID=A0A6H5GF55_9HEMI|nr:unnamed protein product [Nesidiocoris tenuis]